ncbi:M16 family metallopeptidase [Vitreimonas flagellata]|uniref:M16 family metallopeptidase n=1 Tax=Vitreimonas flagellata TaxID=2560861 RepID=UPI00143088E5|nr:pitrilysin family protein [Vitreimonas flagellata]
MLALFASAPLQPAFAQARAESSASRHGVPVRQITSPGGISAWIVSDSTVPMIVLRAYWRGGSAIEAENLTGVTGVMTDMLTEGAGALDANAFKERLEDLNMSVGFSAGWDGIGMSVVTLSENRDAAFEMARLALHEPRFDAAPLERIKRQMLVGIRTRDTNPSYLANLALDQALYPNHPYARRTSRESVAAMNAATLRERRAALFNRTTLQITIVGDIDDAGAGAAIDHVFGALPQGSAPPEPADVSLAAPTPLIVRELPQPQSLVLFAGPGIQDEDPDWIPLAVANYILGGGGFSSRLMDQVREQRGLVYGIGTSPSVRDHSAMVRGSAQTANGNVREAIDVTRAEMARLYSEGATQAEVNDAITYLTGSFALELDSNSKIASVVHSYQTAGRSIDYINQRNDRIRAVTLEDVNRVIRRLFNPDAFTFVVVGQPEGLEPSE